jgi:sulfur carrier protein
LIGDWAFDVGRSALLLLTECNLFASVRGSFSQSMTISLNGEKVDARDGETVAGLIARLQLPPQTILIEHNGVALHRQEWPQRPLSEGDQIELLRVVAGG